MQINLLNKYGFSILGVLIASSVGTLILMALGNSLTIQARLTKQVEQKIKREWIRIRSQLYIDDHSKKDISDKQATSCKALLNDATHGKLKDEIQTLIEHKVQTPQLYTEAGKTIIDRNSEGAYLEITPKDDTKKIKINVSRNQCCKLYEHRPSGYSTDSSYTGVQWTDACHLSIPITGGCRLL